MAAASSRSDRAPTALEAAATPSSVQLVLGLIQNEFGILQFCLLWIRSDVKLDTQQFITISDNVVMSLLHPKFAACLSKSLNLIRRVTLDRVQNILQFKSIVWRQQSMNVVRHDDKISNIKSDIMEVQNRRESYISQTRLPQHTITVPFVQAGNSLETNFRSNDFLSVGESRLKSCSQLAASMSIPRASSHFARSYFHSKSTDSGIESASRQVTK